jgi:hypothetical protein
LRLRDQTLTVSPGENLIRRCCRGMKLFSGRRGCKVVYGFGAA